MPRTQSFDTDEAVRRARDVFWRNGFSDTSLPDLERGTGLNRSSLYNVFGSKQGLYEAVLHDYLREVVTPGLRRFEHDVVGEGALRDYFTALRRAVAEHREGAGRDGCLLLNSAGSAIVREGAVRDLVAAYHRQLCRSLRAGVAARWPHLDDADAGRRAVLLASSASAALTLTRVDLDQALLSVDAALGMIDGP